jgi:hypothetical protein
MTKTKERQRKVTSQAKHKLHTENSKKAPPWTNASSPWTCGCKLTNLSSPLSEFALSSPLLPLVDNVWIMVKMQKCKTKHINIFMSFSKRPNLVSKARNETKITHINHSIDKALPQVIYETTSMWRSKIVRFKKFYQKKARFTCKSLSMSHLSHKHAHHSKIIQG